MTTEKAIAQLEDLIKDRESFCHRDDFDDIFLQDIEALKVGISSLEKQIPKKMKWEYSPVIKIKCPICHTHITSLLAGSAEFTENHKYCSKCGQALDWSDSDE